MIVWDGVRVVVSPWLAVRWWRGRGHDLEMKEFHEIFFFFFFVIDLGMNGS